MDCALPFLSADLRHNAGSTVGIECVPMLRKIVIDELDFIHNTVRIHFFMIYTDHRPNGVQESLRYEISISALLSCF